MRELVLVHGRAQQRKDPVALKKEWLDTLDKGLAKSGLTLPIPRESVRFAYYGDALDQLAGGASPADAADVIIRGDASDALERQFIAAWAVAARDKAGISDAELEALGTDAAILRAGPANWEWVQGVLRAIDRRLPYGSGASIALVTRDVYRYLTNRTIRDEIDEGVAKALSSEREAVVVSHSLGTVVAYNVLRRRGEAGGWKVPRLVTLGSPLGVQKIRQTLQGFDRICCPPCVSSWFNAFDQRDVVALYPLDTNSFPLNPLKPEIENKDDVRNETSNRHGITGYLDDSEVARRIHAALVA
jgi:hypothetical protein